jgi:MFS family permease
MSYIHSFKRFLGGTRSDLDIVLFGGGMGSLFSFLQFITSPYIGRLSDRYGRRSILLLTMVLWALGVGHFLVFERLQLTTLHIVPSIYQAGNALSAMVWLFSNDFAMFVLARVIGGLTEGNVQLSIAIITDVTTSETRSKGLVSVLGTTVASSNLEKRSSDSFVPPRLWLELHLRWALRLALLWEQGLRRSIFRRCSRP